MGADDLEMLLRLVAALFAGALIGYERTYHGRPAGFRTHTLVCTASSLLMLVTVYEDQWVRTAGEMVRLDPTRMAQGIMTGIGFLGAGVIMKEGISVRGLTTAASIWITAAIGILAGIGFYFPLVVSVALTLVTLSLFRLLESRLPAQAYYHVQIRFERASGAGEEALRPLIEAHGFSIADLSYRFDGEERAVRHTMVLRTTNRASAARLSEALAASEGVLEFKITSTGD
ncbi:MgtC/SapB family protein [Luteimonas wenzhouensis]|jgi:putative Mg2+ transporter-C (MgtC) family protein|uniref:Protein MgtC n=1 Tax=Luteimonas wenzhouensis TaxID=2599615 RepID=A0A5C5TTC9_9GAMM|nr:MgtC/SapB family protein [Luteimonas wenzhouensis]NLW97759.1 MgtC/SapB family protein [Xanthomonadaceae bacterium]TWT16839.1 MgtC/SapB family protein [Luteimonas wenzhouensis]